MLRPRSSFGHCELESLYFRVQASFSELLVKIYVIGFLFYGNLKPKAGTLDPLLASL